MLLPCNLLAFFYADPDYFFTRRKVKRAAFVLADYHHYYKGFLTDLVAQSLNSANLTIGAALEMEQLCHSYKLHMSH